MSWDQIERKWAEMTNRMRADVRAPDKKDLSVAIPKQESGMTDLKSPAMAESDCAAEDVTAK